MIGFEWLRPGSVTRGVLFSIFEQYSGFMYF